MSWEANLALVKDAIPILELVRELQESMGYSHGLVVPEWGTDQKTRCPIHHEAHASAKAYVRSNSIFCFVCNRTWDTPGLYAAHHGVPVGEAVRVLLARLGVEFRSSVSNDDLVSQAEALLDEGTAKRQVVVVEAWLDAVAMWATDEASRAWHVEEVYHAIWYGGLSGLSPAESVASIRRLLAWSQGVSEVRQIPFSPPPALSPTVAFLVGLEP